MLTKTSGGWEPFGCPQKKLHTNECSMQYLEFVLGTQCSTWYLVLNAVLGTWYSMQYLEFVLGIQCSTWYWYLALNVVLGTCVWSTPCKSIQLLQNCSVRSAQVGCGGTLQHVRIVVLSCLFVALRCVSCPEMHL